MRRFFARSFTALALAAGSCLAETPFSVDVSDLWWNPSESGWGLNLAQQSDTVFATMFVYGPDGRPRWFSASAMKGVPAGAQDVSFAGRLVESSGPTQPGVFDVSQVSRRDVGSISFQTRGVDSADLTYTVNGVTVVKQVQRLTMKAANASGEYTGYRTVQGCFNFGNQAADSPVTIRILQDAASFTMTTADSLGQTCTYSGTPQQHGRLLSVTGTGSCSNTAPITFELSNMNVSYQGFTAHLFQSMRGFNCQTQARIGGLSSEGVVAGRASVDISDLWWNPAESGWGINFQQQDDLAFATLFTYGADRQPRWYSASDLRMAFALPGGLPSFSGKLYESTGPGFSTAFNAAAVARREVGQVALNPVPGTPDEANLVFSIDGAQYARPVKRLTMKANDSSGTYRGVLAVRSACPGGGTGVYSEQVGVNVTQTAQSFSLTTSGANQTCTYSGGYEQHGRMLSTEGSYTCSGNIADQGSYRITALEVGQEGLTAQISRTASSTSPVNRGCTMSGRIAGVRPF